VAPFDAGATVIHQADQRSSSLCASSMFKRSAMILAAASSLV
jgi:hypothetical protein